MKRIASLVLAAVLLVCVAVPALAATSDAKYSSTYRFLEQLDKEGILYTCEGIDENGDERVVVEYTLSDESECALYIFFDEDGRHCSIRVWNLIDFDAAQVNTMYIVCNYLNSSYRYTTFYVDDSDYSVTVSYDLIFRGDDCGEICFEGIAHVVNICDDAMTTVLAGFRK